MSDYNLKEVNRPVGLLKAVEQLLYWSQISMPQVYGEQLSYANEQGIIVAKVNEVVEQLNVNTEWTQYLLNEGVESETVAYINELIQNGTLASLINNELLGDINSAVDKNTGDINSLKTTKADKEMITNIINGSVKGVYANLAALQAAHPNGAQGIYVTSDNGHWYYYNNGWKDGGVYQAAGFDNEFNLKTSEFMYNRYGDIRINVTLPDSKSIPLHAGDVIFMDNTNNPKPFCFAFSGDTPASPLSYWSERFVVPYDITITYLNVAKITDLSGKFTQEEAEAAINSLTISGKQTLESGMNAQYNLSDTNKYKGEEALFNGFSGTRNYLYDWNVGDLYIVDDESVVLCADIDGQDTYFGSKALYVTEYVKANAQRLFIQTFTKTRITQPPKMLAHKYSDNGLLTINDYELFNNGYLPWMGITYVNNQRVNAQFIAKYNNSGLLVTAEPGYQIAGFAVGGTPNTGWVTRITLNADNQWEYYQVRKSTNTPFDDTDNLKQLVKLIKPSTPITYSTIGQFTGGDGEKLIFVNGASGNDNNNGSLANPVKTINKALSLSKNIKITPGIYFETINISNENKVSITMNDDSTYSSSNPDRPSVKLINGSRLMFESNNNIYRVAHSLVSGSRIDRVFVQKTLPPLNDGSRSTGYNVGLIEEGAGYNGQVFLTPVLTLEEVQSTKGTFTYSNGYIYMNPTNSLVSNYYLLNEDIGSGLVITGCNEVILEDLAIIGSYNQCALLIANNNMKVSNCKFGLSALSDASSWDNTNAQVYNCYGYRARNDGFNIHKYGETHFVNCYGIYNSDDGISHHDGTVGYINGGEYHHNGKGGISPTYGSIINCSNVYTHNNKYGFYQVGSSDYPRRSIQWSSCIALNNSVQDIGISYYDVVAANCVYRTKNVDSATASFTEYGTTNPN